ncbi:MAG TPA: methyltransferase domain-containing protein [Polyangiaceae bacterium]|nr:methyltransferase domain-containing protein [Polyangiaceae bacterium]
MKSGARGALQARKRTTLGPVADLEAHLDPEWWRGLFNATYLKTDADVVENAAATAREVDELIVAAGLTPTDRVLDLCCGQGRHTLELVQRGYGKVTGLDQSRHLLRVARSRARKASLVVRFLEGDARKLALPDTSFDCVAVLGNSFGYFDHADDDLAVLKGARRTLKPGGRLVLDITDGAWMRAHFAPRSWEWLGESELACRERALSADGSRLVCREVVIDADKGVLADQFYAQRLYAQGELEELLARAGFRDVREHATLDTTEGQDLGMMEHRRVWTAVPAEAGAPRAVVRRKRDVLVLFGDPSLPDPVKPDGRFAREDMALVAKTRDALAKIPNFRFRFHDHHASLLDTLRKNPPELALNFCDEGFQNDCSRELHVPALLDLLGIPYSGSGSACLALCLDKSAVSAVARSIGVAAPREIYVAPGELPELPAEMFPVLLKPNAQDGSYGIGREGVAASQREFEAALARLRSALPGHALLAQELLTGREFSVGVVVHPERGLSALPVLEVDYGRLDRTLPAILAYDAKWQPTSPYWNGIDYRRATLDELAEERLKRAALRMFERLGCRDYARFDFRFDARETPHLLDVNPNPAWCHDGELPLMASWAGHSYEDLLGFIVSSAWSRR